MILFNCFFLYNQQQKPKLKMTRYIFLETQIENNEKKNNETWLSTSDCNSAINVSKIAFPFVAIGFT